MSFTYTEKLKPVIIKMIEEGGHTLADIAKACNVSTSFVKNVRDAKITKYINK